MLPEGDARLASREQRERAEAMERMGEVEGRAEREWEEGKARWMEEMDGGNSDSYNNAVAHEKDDTYTSFEFSIKTSEVTMEDGGRGGVLRSLG